MARFDRSPSTPIDLRLSICTKNPYKAHHHKVFLSGLQTHGGLHPNPTTEIRRPFLHRTRSHSNTSGLRAPKRVRVSTCHLRIRNECKCHKSYFAKKMPFSIKESTCLSHDQILFLSYPPTTLSYVRMLSSANNKVRLNVRSTYLATR